MIKYCSVEPEYEHAIYDNSSKNMEVVDGNLYYVDKNKQVACVDINLNLQRLREGMTEAVSRPMASNVNLICVDCKKLVVLHDNYMIGLLEDDMTKDK